MTELKATGLVPILFTHEISEDYVFLKTECIKGKRPNSMKMTDNILQILNRLAKHKLSEDDKEKELKISLSHGDFCPWNMIERENKTKLIDWEMAKNRALGYDLFTYIFQPYFLFHRKCNFEEILNENKKWIHNYFELQNITDFKPYLFSFAKNKLEEEKKKNNIKLRVYTNYSTEK